VHALGPEVVLGVLLLLLSLQKTKSFLVVDFEENKLGERPGRLNRSLEIMRKTEAVFWFYWNFSKANCFDIQNTSLLIPVHRWGFAEVSTWIPSNVHTPHAVVVSEEEQERKKERKIEKRKEQQHERESENQLGAFGSKKNTPSSSTPKIKWNVTEKLFLTFQSDSVESKKARISIR
jgi:hypothetical protein